MKFNKSIIVLCIFLLAVSAYAMVDIAVKTTTSVAYQKISVPISYADNSCVPIACWTSDGAAFYIAQDAAGTGEKYIPTDGTYSNDCVRVDPDGGIMWFKGTVAQADFYVDLGRSNN